MKRFTLSGADPTRYVSGRVRDLFELHINDGGRPVRRPPPSDRLVWELESELGARLPREYLELLRHANGGHPELGTFGSRPGASTGWAVDRFFFLTEDRNTEEGVWLALRRWKPIIGSLALPGAPIGEALERREFA